MVGVTPVLSMLLTALEKMRQREIYFFHANLHEQIQAFKDVLDVLASTHKNLTVHYAYSEAAPKGVIRPKGSNSNVSEGFVDAELVKSIVGEPNASYYFCGPKPFMVNLDRGLLNWGVPSSQIHFEFFGPRQKTENPLVARAA